MRISHFDQIRQLIVGQRLFLHLDQLSDLCHLLYKQCIMKGHERQISQEIKTKPSHSETSPFKFEVFSKNFKKKYHLCDPPSASTSNIAKHFVNERRPEVKNSPQKYNSKNKSQRKRSFEKFTIHTRTTQRTSLNIQPTSQQNLSTKSKLLKITNTLCQNTSSGGKKTLLQIYKSQDQYEKLVKEWQNLDMFDEVDKLIQKIIQHYCNIIQDMLLETNLILKEKLEKYQETIESLAAENATIKKQLAFYSHLEEVLLPIKERLLSEYQKNQWNTFVFNSLALKSFNIEAFIRETPVYKRWVSPIFQHLAGITNQQLEFMNQFDRETVQKSYQSFRVGSKSMDSHMISSFKQLKQQASANK